jgi:hypothetical protein
MVSWGNLNSSMKFCPAFYQDGQNVLEIPLSGVTNI